MMGRNKAPATTFNSQSLDLINKTWRWQMVVLATHVKPRTFVNVRKRRRGMLQVYATPPVALVSPTHVDQPCITLFHYPYE